MSKDRRDILVAKLRDEKSLAGSDQEPGSAVSQLSL